MKHNIVDLLFSSGLCVLFILATPFALVVKIISKVKDERRNTKKIVT